ncbi:hypothetical protein ACQP1W_27680 [Spirillospora sp. CA-255316]
MRDSRWWAATTWASQFASGMFVQREVALMEEQAADKRVEKRTVTERA